MKPEHRCPSCRFLLAKCIPKIVCMKTEVCWVRLKVPSKFFDELWKQRVRRFARYLKDMVIILTFIKVNLEIALAEGNAS